MNNLLCMSLYIIARVGLCLALVAWIVGQCRSFAAVAPAVNSQTVMIRLDPGDWTVSHVPVYMTDGFFIATASQVSPDFFADDHEWMADMVWEVDMGMGEYSYIKTGSTFSFPHWFVVTFCALFYGVPKWVYRKRGKVVHGSGRTEGANH